MTIDRLWFATAWLLLRAPFIVNAFSPATLVTKLTTPYKSSSSINSKANWPAGGGAKEALQLFRRDDEEEQREPDVPSLFDLIVVGSGNGACAFLEQCLLHNKKKDLKILVLEQGQNYFFTSDVTHQNGWSKTYSTGSIFQLHNTQTTSGTPVLSGRACTMGGGGSINYTMIHESSEWLAANIGQTKAYWDKRKVALNKKFHRPDPFGIETPFAKYLQGKAFNVGHYRKASKEHLTEQIPSYQEGPAPNKQLYIFPTQFNEHGQRTNSGVSLVDWRDERLYLRVHREVCELMFEKGNENDDSTCLGVEVKNSKTNKNEQYKLHKGGKLILCGGSASPRLLMRNRDKFRDNHAIGKRVNDHICMPLGVYVVAGDRKDEVGPKDNYESVFAMSMLETENEPAVCNIDFFSGSLERLAFLASSLYLAFVPFNGLKVWLGKNPYAFTLLSNGIRGLLEVIIFFVNILFAICDIIKFQQIGITNPKIATTLVKFNAAKEGQYEDDGSEKITLDFFVNPQDKKVAEEAIKENLEFLSSIGDEPWPILKYLFRLITKIPYDEDQVEEYVSNFSQKTLLSEQHLAGGCVFGMVINNGERDPSQTGKVFGSRNVHVADLSAVPLPRVSTQMTAYLVGHYVGHQLYAPNSRTT